MNEIFINLLMILIIYVIATFIRTRFRDRVSINVIRGIYVFAIAYFVFITIYYSNNLVDNTRRIVQIILSAILIAYFAYKIKTVSNKASQ